MALVPFPGTQSTALQLPPEDPEESGAGKMSFLEHLDELRRRIIHSCLALVAGVVAAFFFHNAIYEFVFAPTQAVLPQGARLVYNEPGEAFALHVTVAVLAGLIVAAPYIMYQVWLFIAPGLYTNEKKLAIPFVVMSTLGFVGGAAFNHYIIFPLMMRFFGSFAGDELLFMPRIGPVFSLYVKMLIAMGLVFQMPTIVLFLAKMKMVTARFLARHIKYAILIIFIVSALITPTGDPGTQAVFAAPMILLYVVSIGIAWIVGPKRFGGDDDSDRH
jgi:sec-independent protein translocase protein TatC